MSSEISNYVSESEYKPLSKDYLKRVRQNKENALQKKKEAKKKEALKNQGDKNQNDGTQGATDSKEDEMLPDRTLADGEVLPQYYGKCPDDLFGQPLEDLDPYYREKGESTFCVATKRFSNIYIYRFTAENAFFFLSPFNPIRRLAVQICVNQFFDYFIMLTIIVNCAFLALDEELVESEYVFTGIYTLEMIIKLLARGLLLRPFTYLRDWWNWLDFVVVTLAWVTIIISASSGSSSFNLSGLRTFRVLRAFKSFTIVPGLKTIVNSLLQSLKPLAEVMVIMLFLVVVISLIALQAFQGVLRRKCVRYSDEFFNLEPAEFNAYASNKSNWNPVSGELVVCGNASSSGLCPDGYVCIQDVGDNPNNGYTNFDNFGWAMLTSFQLLTLDFWENVYNLIIRAEGAWNVLFFFVCVILGPFYLLNLLLAVVALAYSKEHDKQEKLMQMRETARLNARRRVKRRHLLEKLKRARGENGTAKPAIPNGDISKKASQLPAGTEGENASAVVQNSAEEKRSRFQSTRNDMSVDSAESANSTVPEWKRWITKRYESFHGVFCSWICHPKYTRFQENVLIVIVMHKAFTAFVVLSIVANTVFLALDHHGISQEFGYVLSIGNYVFTGIFVLEAVLKILALGFLGYLKDPWNVFDFLIVLISLLEFALPESTGALTVLRTLRLMRVFRLARIWTTMRKLMSIILKSLSAVVYLTIVLFMVLFIFAVVGKQLFGPQYADSHAKFDDNQIPRWNFVDFYHSFLLVWRVMCGEWIEPLYDCIWIVDSPAGCVPFFLLMMFIGNFLVLNLFTAILLAAFNVDNLKSKQVEEEKKRKLAGLVIKAWRKLRKKSKPDQNAETQMSPQQANESLTPTTDREDCGGEKVAQSSDGIEMQKKHPTNMSMASMFALNQAIVKKRRNFDEETTICEFEGDDSVVSGRKRVQTSTVVPHGRAARRGTLTKQSRISDDNIPLHEEMNSRPASNTNDLPVNADPEVGETDTSSQNLSKKVTFAVSANSKVHPRASTPADKSTNRGDVKVTLNSSSCCSSCCFPCAKRSEANEVMSVVTDNREDTDVEEGLEAEDGKKESKAPPRCLPKWCSCCRGRNKEGSGWLAWKKFRLFVFRIVDHKIFEWFILFIILASTVSLALEDINLKNDPGRKHVLDILEYIFTSIFTVEMILKWFGIGVRKYFTSWWCIIDFIIVVVSWIGIGAAAVGQVESLKALRTLRALRPLRAISRWQGMKVVVNALVYCIPSIANVLCVCMLFWLIFSIIGVQLFKGKFHRCEDAEGNVVNVSIVPNVTVCNIFSDYTWTNPRINFDNVINGMIALFQVATFEGWIEVMRDASDTPVNVDEQPYREANKFSYIFFFVFILIGSFFILNLIVGVIIESFQKLRKQTDASSSVEAFLTESQKNFYKTMRTMLNRKPKKTIPPPKNEAQLRVFKLVTHSKFEVVVFSVIMLNMLTLAMEHYQMSSTWASVLRYVDIAFTGLFSLEAFLKIIGTRFYYFRDPFNVFDFVVVSLSIIGFVLEELLTFLVSPTLLRVVRVFRIFRVLRVIRAARGIRRLILTLMISLPALFNIAVLLGVFMVIFAILGMSFFMEVKLRGALNDIVNFRTFANSMMLLFRLMTSAGWNDVLDPLMNDSDCDGDECGHYIIAIIYFVVYIFLVFLVIVNMYIAIILENFDELFQQEESGVAQDDFEFFYKIWGRYDPKASQFVSIAELSNLLHSLHPPFQLAKPNDIKIAALDLPIVNGDKVHCLDVLFALVKRIMGEVEISDEMRREAEARLLKSFPNRKEMKTETTTLMLRRKVKAAKIIQDAWRGFNGKRKRGTTDSSIAELSSPTYSDVELLASQTARIFDRSRAIGEEPRTNEDVFANPNSKELATPRMELIKEVDTDVNASKNFAMGTKPPSEHRRKEITDVEGRVTLNAELNAAGDTINETSFESRPIEGNKLRKRSVGEYVTKVENKSDDFVIQNMHSADTSGDRTETQWAHVVVNSNATRAKKNLSDARLQTFESIDSDASDVNSAGNSKPGVKTAQPPVPTSKRTDAKPLRRLTEVSPVRGKDLRFNPRTGQFKTKGESSDSSAVTNSSTLVNNVAKGGAKIGDQSIIIENPNTSGDQIDV